jgi:hypothetical protein
MVLCPKLKLRSFQNDNLSSLCVRAGGYFARMVNPGRFGSAKSLNSKSSLSMKLKYLTIGFYAGLALTFGPVGFGGTRASAADHADSPTAAEDAPADIADCFLFRDPNDAAGTAVGQLNVVLGMTTHGFIVPGEAKNLAFFDPGVLYRFEIENTGDAKADLFIDVRFSKRTDPTMPQTATIKIPQHGKAPLVLTAPTTPSNAGTAPNPLVVTTDTASGVKFAAGEADDPFFFDLVAFNQFVASVLAGAADPTVFGRARDSFAGYNVMAIAISVPAALIQGKTTNTKIGMSVATLRQTRLISAKGEIVGAGAYRQVDRMGNPAVNVALIPFADKDAYNASNPAADAKKNSKFAADILTTLHALGTTSQDSLNTLASLVITNGDMLHLDLTIQNTGLKGGTNAPAAYPNGRRLADDTIDTLLTVINNGNTLGDGVDASDIAPIDTFPFFAPPHQPLASGVDDGTRN